MPCRGAAPLLIAAACAGADHAESAPATDSSSFEPTNFRFTLANISDPGGLSTSAGPTDIGLGPALVVVHVAGFSLFEAGANAEDTPLESLAEDGDPTALTTALSADPDIAAVRSLAVLDGDYHAAAMLPGESAYVVANVGPEDRVDVVFMFGQSNDTLVATPPGGVAFVPPLSEVGFSMAADLHLYDAGTEVNEEPGAGPNQAPRQAAPDTGIPEGGVITETSGMDAQGYAWPSIPEFLTLTVAPDDP